MKEFIEFLNTIQPKGTWLAVIVVSSANALIIIHATDPWAAIASGMIIGLIWPTNYNR